MSKKIAVVGIGNTFRRDDGIGIIILESLLKFYKREQIDYLNFGIASFDLIHKMRDYDTFILIDGINANLSAGEMKIFELTDVGYKPNILAVSTHEFNLKDIFELFKKLAPKTKVYVAGIQVADTSYGEDLSEGLKYKKEDLVRQVSKFIDKTSS